MNETDGAVRALRGKVVVITGASAGIGAEAARRFAELGATVAVVGRSREKTAAVATRIGARAHTADFASLDSVREVAGELLAAHDRIDMLVNNAGAIFAEHRISADGHELSLQVNHLAPFLLTNLLLDRLAASPDPRVINTGSSQYRGGHLDLDDLDGTPERYAKLKAYGTSKLANLLFMRELAGRAATTGVTTSAFHPGAVATEVTRDSRFQLLVMDSWVGRRLLLSPAQGAQPLFHLASADARSVNGAYYHRLTREEPRNPQAHDPELARRLWDRSAELVGLRTEPATDRNTP
ncbi:SDR family NAD(P)-dependent oxidoreductase [Streptomyces sp. NPDC004539]|uniref:SDR family NAD(P)-dependent oxidoreductase n=1 Tax=Streptomyces sp. NPDC004539 TaxID=3154280 RepID=UPI0033ABF96F